MRPLTVGELLDAALLLLRTHAVALLPMAAVLAIGEQLLLSPVREWASVLVAGRIPDVDALPRYWVLLCLGAGLEAMIIALLAAPAARAAGALLVGRPLSNRAVLRPAGLRPVSTVALAVFAGLVVGLTSFTGVLWAVSFPLLALVVPVLVVDRVNPLRAIGRGVKLAGRMAARGLWVVLLGYVSWWMIRQLVGTLSGYPLRAFVSVEHANQILTVLRVTVNTLAYAALACLVATVHLETRFRTEGLDIALSRGRHGDDPAPLAVNR